MKYRKEIDGLRALAVMPVILFHAGFTAFSGGFVGVDIFFVISGYLITSIIVDEMDRDRFSLLQFYERRARRILPALFFVMSCMLPFAWFWMLPHDLKSFSESLVSVPLFASNVLFYLTSGYFEDASEYKPLLHTWSLAVEEQYYVLFPVFLFLTYRLGKKFIFVTLFIVAVASLFLAQWAIKSHPSFAFYLLPTRAFEVLIGACISLYFNKVAGVVLFDKRISSLGSLIGVFLVLLSIFLFDKNTPSPGFYTLIPTIGSGLIIIFSNNENFIGKVLGNRLLVGLGVVSYSAYLWHQPLFAFARLRSFGEPSAFLFGFLSIFSILFGYLSWRFVEAPFRNGYLISRERVFLCGALGAGVFLFLGLIGHFGQGFPGRLGNGAVGIDRNSEFSNIPRIDNGWCFYSIDTIRSLGVGVNGLRCHIGTTSNRQANGILFGDSFAGSYEPFWDKVGVLNNFKIQSVTTNWCYPSFNDSFTGPRGSRAYAQCLINRNFLRENFEKYDFIVLAGMWSDVLLGNQMGDVVDLIKQMAMRSKLIIIMPSPKQYDRSPIIDYAKSQWFDDFSTFDVKAISANKDLKAVEANEILYYEAKLYDNVVFLGRDSVFLGAEASVGGIPFSADGMHLSIFGSKEVVGNYIASESYAEVMKRILK